MESLLYLQSYRAINFTWWKKERMVTVINNTLVSMSEYYCCQKLKKCRLKKRKRKTNNWSTWLTRLSDTRERSLTETTVDILATFMNNEKKKKMDEVTQAPLYKWMMRRQDRENKCNGHMCQSVTIINCRCGCFKGWTRMHFNVTNNDL